MHFTAQIIKEGEWFGAFCPEVPEANGQGRTEEEAVQSLRAAIELVFEDRRESAGEELLAHGIQPLRSIELACA